MIGNPVMCVVSVSYWESGAIIRFNLKKTQPITRPRSPLPDAATFQRLRASIERGVIACIGPFQIIVFSSAITHLECRLQSSSGRIEPIRAAGT